MSSPKRPSMSKDKTVMKWKLMILQIPLHYLTPDCSLRLAETTLGTNVSQVLHSVWQHCSREPKPISSLKLCAWKLGDRISWSNQSIAGIIVTLKWYFIRAIWHFSYQLVNLLQQPLLILVTKQKWCSWQIEFSQRQGILECLEMIKLWVFILLGIPLESCKDLTDLQNNQVSEVVILRRKALMIFWDSRGTTDKLLNGLVMHSVRYLVSQVNIVCIVCNLRSRYRMQLKLTSLCCQ